MTTKRSLGGKCGDTCPPPAGVMNQGNSADPEPCSNVTTHTLRGKPLCERHWKQGLEARNATEARVRGYSNQLRSYQR